MQNQCHAKIRSQMAILKIHLDHLDEWCHQAQNMLYELEEHILNEEDMEFREKEKKWIGLNI